MSSVRCLSMVSLRLQRMGKKKEPHFRLIAQDKRKNTQSKFLEVLGYLNPGTKEVQLKEHRIKYWLSVGAQATATVHNLLVSKGVIEGNKLKATKTKKKNKDADKTRISADKADEKTEEQKNEGAGGPKIEKQEIKENMEGKEEQEEIKK